jgi:hypothetical protein
MKYRALQDLAFHNGVTGGTDLMKKGEIVPALTGRDMTDKEWSIWDREDRRVKKHEPNVRLDAVRWKGQMRMLVIGVDIGVLLPRRRRKKS